MQFFLFFILFLLEIFLYAFYFFCEKFTSRILVWLTCHKISRAGDFLVVSAGSHVIKSDCVILMTSLDARDILTGIIGDWLALRN